MILHADHGCQYTSAQIAAFTHRHDLARSVGRIALHIPYLRRSPIEGEGEARFAYRPRLNVD